MSEIILQQSDHDGAKDQFRDLYHARRAISAPRESGALSASRLYAFVCGAVDDQVEQALKQDLSVRRVYKTLLRQSAYVHIPQALAASTDEFPQRNGNGCVIRLQASRAENDQLYLIIEMTDQRRDMPKTISVFGADDACETLDLPAARNGVIQTIINKKSDLAYLLADPKTEVFLR